MKNQSFVDMSIIKVSQKLSNKKVICQSNLELPFCVLCRLFVEVFFNVNTMLMLLWGASWM